MKTTSARATTDSDAPPWWRVGMVWLVIGGPAVVVVAALATLVIAVRNPDPVIVEQTPTNAALTPALQARNHAAAPQR